ncbi:Laccase abr2 [Paramyrothecium foliicola]|nr:Laccase abr2 [Paramyrothecium foliicola]
MARTFLPALLAVLAQPFAAVALLDHGTAPTKEFDFVVSKGEANPAGIPREMFLVNGQFPGPVLEVDQDDWVLVRVQNDSPENITIHFHGIEMRNTPWSDGVPGVTQWPIPPSGNYVYEFQARQHGSFWYHAHYRGQIEDGLTGAVVIHPRDTLPRPFGMISNNTKAVAAMELAERNVRPLLISDWTHLNSEDKWDITTASNVEVSCYDAIIINGKGRVECLTPEQITNHTGQIQRNNLALVPGSTISDKGCLPANVMGKLGGARLEVFTENIPKGIFEGCNPTKGFTEVVTPPEAVDPAERWVALDIIAATNFMRAAVAIDEHDMWVYSMDGSYIRPQKVQALVIASGYRYSVLVKTARVGDFKIRVNSMSVPQMLTGHAILSVDGPGKDTTYQSKPHIDIVGKPAAPGVRYFNETIASGFPMRPIPQSADALHLLKMNGDGATYLWVLNSTRLMPEDFEDSLPVLMNPIADANNNVTITTKNDTWVDLVIQSAKYPFPPHPIHKHGNKMFQIGAGSGAFNWSSVDEAIKEKPQYFNLVNPPARDTFESPQAREDIAWLALRYRVTNPGAWMLHCHITNHMLGGMSVIIQDGIDAWPDVPVEYRKPQFGAVEGGR